MDFKVAGFLQIKENLKSGQTWQLKKEDTLDLNKCQKLLSRSLYNHYTGELALTEPSVKKLENFAEAKLYCLYALTYSIYAKEN